MALAANLKDSFVFSASEIEAQSSMQIAPKDETRRPFPVFSASELLCNNPVADSYRDSLAEYSDDLFDVCLFWDFLHRLEPAAERPRLLDGKGEGHAQAQVGRVRQHLAYPVHLFGCPGNKDERKVAGGPGFAKVYR